MPTVRLSFSPAPAHVRTARLVAVAVARRAGVADELLEEIRLAIGEACSRAVALHRSHGVEQLIDLAMGDGERFTVRVTDRVANGLVDNAPDPATFLKDAPTVELSRAAELSGAMADELSEDTTVELSEAMAEEAVAAKMGLALLAGLVDDLEVRGTGDGQGTVVSMSWPVSHKPTDA
jgi:anti-sigma regulatory factor (Ser/Thr protein kinase)